MAKKRAVDAAKEAPADAGTKDQGGRPPFTPTPEQRKMVETLAGYGLVQKQICSLVTNPETGKPISEKTLREHFEDELAVGEARGDLAVLQSLFHQAVGRDAVYDENRNKLREEMKPVPACTIFAAKARKGIKATERHELTGANGGAIQHELQIDPERLKAMPDDELAALERALGKLQRGDGGGAGRAPAAANENAYAATLNAGKG